MTNDLQKLAEIVVSNYDVELAKLSYSDEKLNLIVEKFYEYASSSDIHTFFILRQIESKVDDIFMHVSLRDFVLHLTDVCLFDAKAQNLDLSVIVDNIVDSVCRNKINPSKEHNNSLIPANIASGLYINEFALRDLLMDNVWLMILYVLILKYSYTETFKASVR